MWGVGTWVEHGEPAAIVVMIVLLTWTNTRGVKLGAAVQNVFTSAKVLALLG
jgi:APA family basic amino acid/polyamine antiporter